MSTPPRIPKYRVWDYPSGTMGEVTTLQLSFKCVVSTAHEYRRTLGEVALMECTDMKDTKGKDIYEGDLVRGMMATAGWGAKKRKEKECIFEVVRGTGWTPAWNMRTKTKLPPDYRFYPGWGDVEVVGHIYNQLELVK